MAVEIKYLGVQIPSSLGKIYDINYNDLIQNILYLRQSNIRTNMVALVSTLVENVGVSIHQSV